MNVTPRKWYVVTTDSECVVTDANGKVLCTATAGEQKLFYATTPVVTLSDETATVGEANFKRAALALGLLGGGKRGLPAGYTRLDFLKGTGSQWVNTLYTFKETSGACVDYKCLTDLALYVAGSNNPRSFIPTSTVGRRSFAWNSVYYHMGGARLTQFSRALGSINYMGDKLAICIDEAATIKKSVSAFSPTEQTTTFALFRENPDAAGAPTQIYSAQISENEDVVCDFIPTLDPTGTPCMFDLVSKQSFRNAGSGRFIAGFTLAQAAQLGRKLPNSGGTLTLSLPEGYDMDERIVNALTEAESKGWVLTIQTYAAATAAATFALRRVWVRRQQDENGTYVDADGSRWLVEWCVDVIGADPESLGYERFRSVDAAADYWGLTHYVNPEAEPETETETLTAE